MLRSLAIVALSVLVLGCGGSAPAVQTFMISGMLGTPASAIFSANVLRVGAQIDAVTAPLILDTGAPLTALDPAALPALSVPASGTVDSITVGGLEILKVPVVSISLGLSNPTSESYLAGLLGGGALLQFSVVLDYQNEQVSIGIPVEPTNVATPIVTSFNIEGGGFGTLAGSSAQIQIPATRVILQGDIEGAKHTLLVDTGASYVVISTELFSSLSADGRAQLLGLPLTTINGETTARLMRVRTFALGNASLSNVVVSDIGDEILKQAGSEVGHNVDGIVGGSYLREFLTTLDYPGRKLTLAHYDNLDHLDPDEFHQLGFTLVAASSGHRFAVGQVFAGTNAESQGVTAGDQVVSISQQSLDDLTLAAASSLLSGAVGAMRPVVFERANQMISLTVRVDDLLPPLN